MTENPCVPGSIPGLATKFPLKIKRLQDNRLFIF